MNKIWKFVKDHAVIITAAILTKMFNLSLLTIIIIMIIAVMIDIKRGN